MQHGTEEVFLSTYKHPRTYLKEKFKQHHLNSVKYKRQESKDDADL